MDTYWADSTGRRNTFDHIRFKQAVERFCRRAITRFRVRFIADNPLDKNPRIGADAISLPDQTCRAYPGMPLMRFGHMFLHCDVSIALGTAAMRRNPLVVEIFRPPDASGVR